MRSQARGWACLSSALSGRVCDGGRSALARPHVPLCSEAGRLRARTSCAVADHAVACALWWHVVVARCAVEVAIRLALDPIAAPPLA